MQIATLRDNCMLVTGARFFAGQRFVVRREFSAVGDNGWVQCLSLGNETGEYLIPCIDKSDVDLEEIEPCGSQSRSFAESSLGLAGCCGVSA